MGSLNTKETQTAISPHRRPSGQTFITTPGLTGAVQFGLSASEVKQEKEEPHKR